MSARWAVALSLAAVAAAGCGAVHRTLPEDIRTVAIAAFTDQTGQSQLPGFLAEELRRAVRLDGRLAVIEDVGRADAILMGTIREYGRTPARFDPNNVVQEYRVRLAVEVALTDRTRTRRLWTDRAGAAPAGVSAATRRLERSTNQVVVPASGLPVETETDVQRRLARDVAGELVLKAIEGW